MLRGAGFHAQLLNEPQDAFPESDEYGTAVGFELELDELLDDATPVRTECVLDAAYEDTLPPGTTPMGSSVSVQESSSQSNHAAIR
jgi:hypothetical protein